MLFPLNFRKVMFALIHGYFPEIQVFVSDAVRINHERMTYEKGERLV